VLEKLKPGGVVDNIPVEGTGITTSVWFWFVFFWFCLFYILLVVVVVAKVVVKVVLKVLLKFNQVIAVVKVIVVAVV